MNELALFAGAGGGQLASRLLGWRTVCYVENAKYAVEVLAARIRDGYLDDAPIWDDARTFDGRPWAGRVDIISAGFPCQPFSGAGRQLGERDWRNLWPDTLRIIREVGPEWVLLENVSRLLSHAYLRRIFGDLAESGYDAEWDCIPACAVGAPHIRDRVWIVAHAAVKHRAINRPETLITGWSGETMAYSRSQPGGLQLQPRSESSEIGRGGADISESESGCDGAIRSMAYASGNELEEQRDIRSFQGFTEGDWWATEPELGRVADELADRLDLS